MSQPLNLQVKKGGSTSGHLLWVMPCAQAAERQTTETQSCLPQRAPSKNNTYRTFSEGHMLAENPTYSSFILAATPISQTRGLGQAARREVTQEVGGGLSHPGSLSRGCAQNRPLSPPAPSYIPRLDGPLPFPPPCRRSWVECPPSVK